MRSFSWYVVVWLCCAPVWASVFNNAGAATIESGNLYTASDTLVCDDDADADAVDCLDGLRWDPGEFIVSIEDPEIGFGDWLVRFPTPKPIGNPSNDLVAMEWYAARNEEGDVIEAPAVVVVHESGRRMVAGRMVARGLSTQGLHAFMLHLPGYGARSLRRDLDMNQALSTLTQAIADVRRARDAVAVLPYVDQSNVGLQGTSLGGFVAATVAGLDSGYNHVFIFLAGGHIHEVLLNGRRDAARLREQLAKVGVGEAEIVALARPVEPMRLAHRMNPESVWIYSGKHDDVVSPASSRALAIAAGLPQGHHIEMAADHYSGFIYLPFVLQQMHDKMVAE